MKTHRLAAGVQATLIHGKTGMEVSEDYLPSGTRIAGISTECSWLGDSTSFLAKDGAQWFRYRIHGPLPLSGQRKP